MRRNDRSKPDCLDPIFGPVIGANGLRTCPALYWSSTIDASSQPMPTHILVINTSDCQVYSVLEAEMLAVWALRGPIQMSDLVTP